MDIGIDLGTTCSVIAVKGNIRLTSSFTGTYLQECDVTIIPTPEGSLTYPTVLWWDPSEPDKFVVGTEAKQKTAEGCRPVMFCKRAIGTKEKLRMNHRLFSTKEVAVQILKYLKACAEQALGASVHRAVVTHPAFFNRNQVQETLEAAQEAGFEMEPAQMMIEPAAAALAYTQNDERDPLRVLTYDLGGGTFDVTVLEKCQGILTIKSFEGNPRLGGYNFDRALVQWVLAELERQGRNILYDENNEQDRGRHARLLQVAEEIKIRLSEQHTAKAPVPVNIDFLVDDQGRLAQFLGRITREQFTELIKESLDETIDCCRRALASAGMDVADLHAVLLVGGSTYGPWVQDAIEDAFNVHVESYNPELCVAAGAAIVAAKLPKKTSGAGVEIRLDAKGTYVLPSTNISGVIEPSPGSRYDQAACRNLLVMLATPDGGTLCPAKVGEDGTFSFEDIALPEEGEVGEYTVSVCDGSTELLRNSFRMAYQPEVGIETAINTVLQKTIYLRTADGLAPVVEEGIVLPAKSEIKLKKISGDSVVTPPVVQEGEEIGIIRVDNIPENAGDGSLILISVEVTQKNEMRGTAKIMNRTGEVLSQLEFRINFPPTEIPELQNLRAQFEDLNDKREQTILLTEDPAERLTLAGPGETLVKKLRKLFEEQEPDRQEINHELKRLDKMVNPPPDDMDPSRRQFVSMLEECREMLGAKAEDPNMQSFLPILKRIEKDGNDAHATKNRKKWDAVADSLRQAHARIEKAGGGDRAMAAPEPPPLTPLMKDQCAQSVDDLRSLLRMVQEKAATRGDYGTKDRPRCEALQRDLDALEKGIGKVADDLPPEQGLRQLRLVMRPLDAIKKKIRMISEQVDTEKYHENLDQEFGKAHRHHEADKVIEDGKEHLQSERFGEAVATFTKALALVPDEPTVLFLRAQAYLGLGEIGKALEDSREFSRMVSEHLPSEMREAAEKLERTIKERGESIRKFGLHVPMLRQEAAKAYMADQYALAESMLRNAICICPEAGKHDLECALSIVLANWAVHDVNNAGSSASNFALSTVERHLQEAIRLDPSNQHARTNLATLKGMLSSAIGRRNGSTVYGDAPSADPLCQTTDIEKNGLLPSASCSTGQESVLVSSEVSPSPVASEEGRRAEVPTSRIDKVHFSVSCPPAANSGETCIVYVWAHLERQRAKVEHLIQQAYPQTDSRPVICPKGPFKIERGTTLVVRLKFQDFRVKPPEDVILWAGEIGDASFEVDVPEDIAPGPKVGLVTVHLDGGLQIARVPIQILVAPKVQSITPTTQTIHHIRKAFASYASADREDVLASIQGMQKIAPQLKVFYDEANLRSGSNWEQELRRVIPDNDVLYLFWSAAAKASRWVEMEWRCGLSSRGIEFIDPVPLVSPEEVPTPEELSGKHFKDWVLAYRRRRPKGD